MLIWLHNSRFKCHVGNNAAVERRCKRIYSSVRVIYVARRRKLMMVIIEKQYRVESETNLWPVLIIRRSVKRTTTLQFFFARYEWKNGLGWTVRVRDVGAIWRIFCYVFVIAKVQKFIVNLPKKINEIANKSVDWFGNLDLSVWSRCLFITCWYFFLQFFVLACVAEWIWC